MKANAGRIATQPVSLVLLSRLCELLGALLFLPVLPWWKPALWFVLVASAGTWGFLRVRRADFKTLPLRQRRGMVLLAHIRDQHR